MARVTDPVEEKTSLVSGIPISLKNQTGQPAVKKNKLVDYCVNQHQVMG